MKKVLFILILSMLFLSALYADRSIGYAISEPVSINTIGASLINGLVAYYPFNGNANDESGNENHGDVNGAILSLDRFENINSAYEFNGSSDFIEVDNDLSLNINSSFSISLWFKPGELNRYQRLIGKGTSVDGSISNWSITYEENNSLAFFWESANDDDHLIYSNTIINDSNFHNITVYIDVDLDKYAIYIDGVFDKMQTTSDIPASNNDPLYIGVRRTQTSFERYFNGVIDDIRIFDRVLTESEIIQLYQAENYQQIVIDPPTGSYVDDIWVKINCDTPDIIIRYTTDGSEPTENHGITYVDSLHLSPSGENQTYEIKAVALLEREQRDGSTYTIEIDRADANYLLNYNDLDLINFQFEDVAYGENVTHIELVFGFSIANREPVEETTTLTVTDNEISISVMTLDYLLSPIPFPYLFPGEHFQILGVRIFNDSTLLGHMNFNYTYSDYINNRNIEAKLFIHGDADQSNFPGWEYYEPLERMVSMLIPPQNSFGSINTDKKPMLLIHGLFGKYPYWNPYFILGLNGEYNPGDIEFTGDVWQFYYPYDQQVEQSASLLHNAIEEIRNEGYQGNNNNINIIAHSMGGLVARQYIQSTEYSHNINKLLMLGTPNHGSYASYNLVKGTLTGKLGEWFKNYDPNAPACSQLIPASEFLFDLNSSSPVSLEASDGINYKNYLIIAGTDDFLLGHAEITLMDDGVVAVQSANLLELQIPLATINLQHNTYNGLQGGLSHTIPLNFFNNEYDPYQPGTNESYQYVVNNVDGYWISENSSGLNIIERKPDSNLPLNQPGMLQVEFNHVLDSESIYLGGNEDKLYMSFNLVDYFLLSGYWSDIAILKNSLDNLHTNFFLTKQEGFGMGNIFSETQFNSIVLKSGLLMIKEISTDLFFPNQITSMLELDLSDGELALINLKNSINTFSSRIVRDRNNRSVIEEEYFVDATMDSMVFYIGGFEDDPNFVDHQMTLIAPDETIVDSAYANNDPNMEYSEDIDNGFAFYYVVNPQQGLWKLQYNDALQDSNTIAFVDSPISIYIEFPDTNYVQNDSIFFEIPLPQPIEYTNVQISAELFYNTQSDSLLSIGNIPLYLSVDSLSYQGSFLAEDFGLYEITVDFNCTFNGEQIERHTYNSVLVSNVSAPILLTPENGSVNRPLELTLAWHSAKNATSYNIQVFAGSDTLTFTEASISDTTFILTGLSNNTEYYWQVNSENGNGSSNWSNANYFLTKITLPQLVLPENEDDGISSMASLIWDHVENAENYLVQLAFDVSFIDPIISDSTVTDTIYSLNSLINDYTYFWRVSAKDTYGGSDWSEARSFTVREFEINFPEVIEFPEDSTTVIYLPDYISDFELGRTIVDVTGINNIYTSQDDYSLTISAEENWYGQESLIITVFDGINATRATAVDTMSTSVTPVNDPPTIILPDSLNFFYGQSYEVDFSLFIDDVDNATNELSLTYEENLNIDIQIVDHLVTLSGINNWVGNDTLTFFIDDGMNPVRQVKRNARKQTTDSYTEDSRINNQDKSMSIPKNTRALTSDQVLVIVNLMIPENVSIENNDGVCLISWNPVPAANGYIVYSSTDPNALFSEWTLETLSPIADTYWVDTENVDKKFFRIVAVKTQSTARIIRSNKSRLKPIKKNDLKDNITERRLKKK